MMNKTFLFKYLLRLLRSAIPLYDIYYLLWMIEIYFFAGMYFINKINSVSAYLFVFFLKLFSDDQIRMDNYSGEMRSKYLKKLVNFVIIFGSLGLVNKRSHLFYIKVCVYSPLL